ncbi:hypothetical protein AAEP93_004267 [Penicillium crustosum]
MAELDRASNYTFSIALSIAYRASFPYAESHVESYIQFYAISSSDSVDYAVTEAGTVTVLALGAPPRYREPNRGDETPIDPPVGRPPIRTTI